MAVANKNNFNNDQIWQTVLGELELTISRANFITWFKNTKISSNKDGIITVSVPNGFTKEWLKNKYNKFILQALQKNNPDIQEVKYEIGAVPQTAPLGINTKNLRTEQGKDIDFVDKITRTIPISVCEEQIIDSETNLNPRYTFSSFVTGSNNELAYAACLAVTKNLGLTYNPLFIYGRAGLGKTHLLQSIGNETLRLYPDKKVRYTTSEKFTNELINAIQNHQTEQFKTYYRDIDILIIDDIQFLAGKEKTQEEFFHTFNALYQQNKQIVLSSDRPPKAIPTIEERLRSRFEGGMIADITYPDFETRMAILKTKAQEKGSVIDEEILKYIATHIQRNIRELEGALNQIIATCQLDNSEPTLEKAQKLLANVISPVFRRAITPKEILKAVSEFYNLPLDNLIKKDRRKELVKPRQVAMYLMRKEIKSSYPAIGEVIGGRDHTTAIHAYEKIEKELENDKNLEQEINLIKERLYSSLG